VDWTTTAAMLALFDLCLREPVRVGALAQRIWTLIGFGDAPIWFECVERPAVAMLHRLPGLPEWIVEDVAIRRRRIEVEAKPPAT
jgi:hypothetical protein